MKLSDVACRNAKATGKTYRLADGGGLYLEVSPKGGRYWRLKYRFAGKEKRLALGVYPEVSLLEAREGRELARKQLAQNIDPSLDRQDKRIKVFQAHQNSFEVIAREWHDTKRHSWSEDYAREVLAKLEADIFPQIGARPIAELDAPIVLEALRRIERRGAIEVAHRTKQICGQVFRYGIATGRCKYDPAADLKNALRAVKRSHFAALEFSELPELLAALETNNARLFPQTRRAIKLLMLTFVRTSELIEANWSEIDLIAGRWTIPGHRMKMKRDHIVPLSRQAIALLEEQRQAVGHLNTPYIFPSRSKPRQPMSNNTILKALQEMGYRGRMTGHGFRALARTAIREKLNYDPDIIERQLAHAPASKTVAAYDRTKFLDQRQRMMQEWADLVDRPLGGDLLFFGSANHIRQS